MYNPTVLRALIQQTLTPLGLYSVAAEELLMATCAQESLLGTFRTQAPHGPARGIFQDEGEDFDDLWTNFLQYHATLASQVKALNGGAQGTADDLVNNDTYAIAVCRVHYLRSPMALPDPTNLAALWHAYKIAYNTIQGAATQAQFIEHYKLTGGSAQ
jgi:hypothetical protein